MKPETFETLLHWLVQEPGKKDEKAFAFTVRHLHKLYEIAYQEGATSCAHGPQMVDGAPERYLPDPEEVLKGVEPTPSDSVHSCPDHSRNVSDKGGSSTPTSVPECLKKYRVGNMGRFCWISDTTLNVPGTGINVVGILYTEMAASDFKAALEVLGGSSAEGEEKP